MDPQLIWNDLLLNPVDTQNLPGESSMPFVDLTNDEPAELSIWNSSGSSSSVHSLNRGTSEEAKREHNWASPLTIIESQGSRTEERQLENSNMMLGPRTDEGSFRDMHLNLNSNHVDDTQSSRNSNFLQLSASTDRQLQFSVPFVPASSSVNTASGIEGRPGSSFDGRCLPNKRKSIEGISASGSSSCLYHSENSANQNANTALSIASSPSYPFGMSSVGSGTTGSVQASDRHVLTIGSSSSYPLSMNPAGSGTMSGAQVSDHQAYNVSGRTESSQRNCRSRINPSQQSAPSPNQWSSRNNILSHQAPNLLTPFNQSLDPRVLVATGTSESQPPVLPVPVSIQSIHSFPVNVAPRSSTRTTNSSLRSPMVAGQIVSQHSVFTPTTEVRNVMQPSSSWSLTPALQNGNNARVVQAPGPTWMPHQNPPTQPQRQLLVPPPGGPGSGQSVNVPSLSSATTVSNTLQEIRNQRASIVRSHQHVPLSLRTISATRESRSRMLEQIRNAIQLAWRGERMALEDAIFDHAVFIGGPIDLHDRHRDMRLDVDNMSYEELLALEERIGNVNTGLSAKKVLKRLKQRKYISLSEETANEVEPCCICQEEYMEGEDVGRLDCGHDFHTDCIKEWLMLKNLCPICKTTGLAL